MEDAHKHILRRNRVALVEKLKPSDLYDALLERRIFSQDMIDEIKVILCSQEHVPFRQLVSTQVIRLVVVAELGYQAGSGQAAGGGLGNPGESSFPDVPGESSGDGSAGFAGAPAERSPSCSHSASHTRPVGPTSPAAAASL